MSQDAPSTCIGAVEEKHESLTPIAEQRCMYKVHEQLRKVNEEAYKPVLLAIGPYNYNQGEPVGGAFMKEHKERYLQQMLDRTKGSEKRYMKALEKLEGKARECYAECTSLTREHEFAKMMLLDGCFIIELFSKYEVYKKPRDSRNPEENERFKKYILNDPIFKMKWVLPRIARDLLLFENQLPFFVLVELLRMSTESRNSGEHVVDIYVESSTSTDLHKLSHLALKFFCRYLPFKWDVDAQNYNSKEKIGNLVRLMQGALMHKDLIPSLPKMVWKRLQVGFRFKNVDQFEHLLGLIHASISISILDTEIEHHEAKVILKKPLFGLISKLVIPLLAERKDMSNQEPLLKRKMQGLEGDSEENADQTDQVWERELIPYWSEIKEAGITFKMAKEFKDHVEKIQACREKIGVVNIHGATELEEAGIEFKELEKDKKLENHNMFSIKFDNARMEVSPLSIEDHTETCLRNLIAYEQYCDRDESLNYVTNYVSFMDSLINSPKDVELLRQKGIIQNYLGDDKATSTMVNKLGHYINLPTYDIYSRTSRNLNDHCKGCWNNQMAKLRHDYFNSPWAWISFLAATLLLLLTFVQTIFSIIP